MSKKAKVIIAVVLLIALTVSGAGGYLLLIYQPKPVVNDYTVQNPDQNGAGSNMAGGDGEDTANTAVFSSGVEFFTESTASEINNAIHDYEITNMGLMLEIDKGTPLDILGVGDIFYLEGDPSTPLGETYIGKIISVSEDSDSMTYVLDDPMIDEVFDVLNLELSEVLTSDNISEIETAEGVTVTMVDALDSYFTSSDSTSSGYQVTTLQSTGSEAKTASQTSFADDGKLLVDVQLDILEALGLDDKDTSEFQEKYAFQEGGRITVYRTTTGMCYHRDNCACVARSKYPMTLTEAINEGFQACFLCNPPLLSNDEGVFEFDPSLTLTGRIGLENIACDLIFDWDIMSGKGLENLGFDVSGNYLAELELESSLEWEFGGRTTTISLPFDCVKLQGLDEKLIPLMFVGYNFSTVVSATFLDGNESIRAQTAAMPLTLAAVVYVDISGKVGISGTANFNYKESFDHNLDIVRNGEWVFDSKFSEGEPTTELSLGVEASGDIDAHAGASLMVYVFNLNPVELALAKVGTEVEGTLKLSYSTKTGSADDAISKSYYMRVYLKLLEVNIKLKAAVKFGNVSVNMLNADASFAALDYTIFECGAKNPTQYSSSEMSYSVITANDAKNYYYKDTNGNLIKETDGYRTTLYSDGFFTICGIDESYIYLLRNNPDVSGTHDIYRVSVHDGTNKKIASEITNCLTTDERYIYYVSNFDSNTIVRLDRETLKEENFYHGSNTVQYMTEQGGGFYVVTEHSDIFSWLTGAEIHYTLLDKVGNVVTEYGQNPPVSSLVLSRLKSYYYAAKIISPGYLRSTAEKAYWLSADRTSHIETECVSGWMPTDAGIFTTLRNDDTAENAAPFTIILYQAADGSRIEVTDVQSDQAFFTLCQSSYGDWYFFDQTEDSLILYTMKKDFSGKSVVKTFSLDELPCSLTECGMVIMNNRIYFYTIPNNSTSTVLYRYDIV